MPHETAMKSLARQLLAEIERAKSDGRKIIRAEAHLDKLDLLAWLEAQKDDVKTYWSDREQRFAMAGIGAASTVAGEPPLDYSDVITRLRSALSPDYPSLQYYGGFSFDRVAQVGEWKDFGAYRFVIPRIEVSKRGESYYLTYNLDASEIEGFSQDALMRELGGLDFSKRDGESSLPRVLSRCDRPEEQGWREGVEKVLRAFDSEDLRKVVLARESLFEFEEEADPVAVLRRLVTNTTYSYRFCFQLRPGLAFVGASPERLYHRRNTYIQSEALAGTRPRSGDPDEDDRLSREFLNNDKELREHRFVVDQIEQVFDKHCHAVRRPHKPALLALRHYQHLRTPLEGMLHEPSSDGPLLEDLHPTPAVGGVPTARALEYIRAVEPFSRGWYAAPIGWVAYDAAEFAVAIRSGLCAGANLSLYSGAGIVPGSEPESEWNEIEHKMRNFLNILEWAKEPRDSSGLGAGVVS